MPGVSATVGEQIEALRKAAGDKAVALIKRVDDPFVQKIVLGWAGRYEPKLATSMGFKAEKNFDEIIAVYQEDETARLNRAIKRVGNCHEEDFDRRVCRLPAAVRVAGATALSKERLAGLWL